MLKHRMFLTAVGFCSFLVVSACSSDKIIPQGKRLSVLEQTAVIKPEVSDVERIISVPVAVKNANWLQPEMNAQHIIPNIEAGTSFQKQWAASFGSGSSKREFLISKPLVANGVVYGLDAKARLSAINLRDGEKLWSVNITSVNSNVNDTALKGVGMAIDNEVVFVTTGFGFVAALKADDGEKIWSRDLISPLRIAPMVAGGKVFVQSVDNKFYALDAASGEILWDYDIAMEDTTMVGGAVAAYSPSLDVVLTGFSNGEIQSFNATIGSPLWSDILVANRQAYSSTFLHTIKASPVIDGETAYILGSSNVFTAVDIRSGERLWEKEIGGVNTPLLVNNVLYAVSSDNELVALDKSNGNVLWSVPVKGAKKNRAVVYAPIMLSGRLVVAASNGVVTSYDPKSGKLLGTVDLDEDLNSAPIASDGYIIFSTAKAELLAYK